MISIETRRHRKSPPLKERKKATCRREDLMASPIKHLMHKNLFVQDRDQATNAKRKTQKSIKPRKSDRERKEANQFIFIHVYILF